MRSGVWRLLLAAALLGLPPSGPRPQVLRVMGATSLVPYLQAVIPAFERQRPGVRVSLSAGGSFAGLEAVRRGQVEAGLSDLPVPEGPAWRGLRALPLGCLAVVPIVHPRLGLRRLSAGQLAAVLEGRVRNWREVGGPDLPVVVVVRPRASGARAVLEEGLHLRGFSPRAVVQLSNGAVARTVQETPGAVGFVEAPFVRPGVQVLDVGPYHYGGDGPWPFQARLALVARRPVAPEVAELAAFAASWPGRAAYGIRACPPSSGGTGRGGEPYHRGDRPRAPGAQPQPGDGEPAGGSLHHGHCPAGGAGGGDPGAPGAARRRPAGPPGSGDRPGRAGLGPGGGPLRPATLSLGIGGGDGHRPGGGGAPGGRHGGDGDPHPRTLLAGAGPLPAHRLHGGAIGHLRLVGARGGGAGGAGPDRRAGLQSASGRPDGRDHGAADVRPAGGGGAGGGARYLGAGLAGPGGDRGPDLVAAGAAGGGSGPAPGAGPGHGPGPGRNPGRADGGGRADHFQLESSTPGGHPHQPDPDRHGGPAGGDARACRPGRDGSGPAGSDVGGSARGGVPYPAARLAGGTGAG
ncbi:protein of unknown function [Candidatus Hydrogenisulfobacillus filiaventi]|uniref:PBP domain-containing protein n=1 Tax=Candidatus Hydrogenisulfobacillus filiaventi TaxID=2707344 RepID=A0A6F8ZIX2_9FIRM|nr:protein of unknown function [Candidatus Hydrogenisulfobacillus filiaventi]